jgi:DNA polymerase-1
MKVLVDTDVLLYISCWNKNDLIHAIEHWEDLVKNIADEIALQCTEEEPPVIEMMFALKGEDNFRKLIAPDYKQTSSRKASKENKYLDGLYDYIREHWNPTICDGWEADDQLRAWTVQYSNEDWIIVSVDKDLRMIPGKFFNPRTFEILDVNEDEADYNFHIQLLTGDAVDNIKGIKGIGPKKAAKILEGVPMGQRKTAVDIAWTGIDGQQLCHDLIYIYPSKEEIPYERYGLSRPIPGDGEAA